MLTTRAWRGDGSGGGVRDIAVAAEGMNAGGARSDNGGLLLAGLFARSA